jgi:hypothetical protein
MCPTEKVVYRSAIWKRRAIAQSRKLASLMLDGCFSSMRIMSRTLKLINVPH